MNREPFIPLMCFGYCRFTNEYDNVPGHAIPKDMMIEISTFAEARKKGWTTTQNIKFSSDGSVVLLCPDCSKQWAKEKQEILKHLLSCKRKLHEEYLHTDASDEGFQQRQQIREVRLKGLEAEFRSYAPNYEEWNEWFEISN